MNWHRIARRKLGRRDGWKCHYCSTSLSIDTSTLDHVIPRALGGSSRLSNLRLACLCCNRAKADKPPHVYHALLMQGLIA